MTYSSDVLIVGAGPGGLSAALAAANCGLKVTIVDAYPEPGGQYYHQPPSRYRNEATNRQKVGRILWRRAVNAGVEIRSSTIVWNLDNKKNASIHGSGGTETIHGEIVILATGAYERTVAFPGWTLPGVITAGAAQTLLYRRVKPGKRVLLAGTGPLQLVTAANLLDAHMKVICVLEAARLYPSIDGGIALVGQWGRIREGSRSIAQLFWHRVPYRVGWGILRAHGREQVEGATIAQLNSEWQPIPGSEQEVSCDTICTGYGFIPFNALAKMAGAKFVWDTALGGEVPVRDEYFRTSIPGIYAIGDSAGIGGYRMALYEGAIAGASAAVDLGHRVPLAEKIFQSTSRKLRNEQRFQKYYSRLFTPKDGIFELSHPDTIVCRCEGITRDMIEKAVCCSGAKTLQELKAVTRCGMGECQGRVCGPTISRMVSKLTGMSMDSIGSFASRLPIFPLPAGSFQITQD